MIQLTIDAAGIALLVWDMPGRRQNVLNPLSGQAWCTALTAAINDPAVKGIILCSGKRDFCAGADVAWLAQAKDAGQLFDQIRQLQGCLRTLETCGKPVAVAISGACLGAGLALALAGHYRVAANDAATRLGLPEVALGLVPGLGVTQRLARLIGIPAALPLLLEGRRLGPDEARDLGILQDVVLPGQEVLAARAWLMSASASHLQPWDGKGYAIPGGAVASAAMQQRFMLTNAQLRAKTFGNYPAPRSILSCVYEGLLTDIDTGLATEARYVVQMALSPEAKAMMQTLFLRRHPLPILSPETVEFAGLQSPLLMPEQRVLIGRLLGAYMAQGLALAAQGVSPALINNAGRLAGMPWGPLALAERLGTLESSALGSGIEAPSPVSASQPDVNDVIACLITIQQIEALRCVEQGLVSDAAVADLVAVLGAGFPAFRGGPLYAIDVLGIDNFVAQCAGLTARHGAAFAVPANLRASWARGQQLTST